MERNRCAGDILRYAESLLSAKGIPDARIDAEVLLAHLLDINRMDFIVKNDMMVSGGVISSYMELIRQRISRKPVAYLTGEKEFMGLKFFLNEDVLIPRPETELLVEETIKHIRSYNHRKNGKVVKILDMCTGSGNIAVSIAKYLKEDKGIVFDMFASDVDARALDVAGRNAQINGVSDDIRFFAGDLFNPFSSGDFFCNMDFIVSNPPYIRSGDLACIQEEVLREPARALDAGEDGLMFYRRIINEAGMYLVEGGFIIMEIGSEQGSEVRKIINDTGELSLKRIVKDYSGKDRIVVVNLGTRT